MTCRVQANPSRVNPPISGSYLIVDVDRRRQYLVPEGILETLVRMTPQSTARLPRHLQFGYIPPAEQSKDFASQISAPISINRVIELIDEGAISDYEFSPFP